MDKPVIRVEDLGKEYIIGYTEKIDTFGELIVSSLTKPLQRFQKLSGRVDAKERFWALKGVNFKVHQGEVVGIIGRNGAGKSTLLKILSRITAPTTGRLRIYGRVASLLEVGTGFHPELTGRENIYLNGAILGMSRAEIRRKFDEIVNFAEIDKFLETPVKRYSSGMYVRLAFAVAAHLDPEILIVDEVLAVGDSEFQRKCLGKIGQVARGGRTVLFVSHNIAAVRALCTRAILLHEGQVVADSGVSKAIELYLGSSSASSDPLKWHWADVSSPGDSSFRLRSMSIATSTQESTAEVSTEHDFEIIIEYQKYIRLRGLRLSIQLARVSGEVAFTTSDHSVRSLKTDEPGIGISKCHIPKNLLNVGRYVIRLSVDIPGVRAILEWLDIGSFDVKGRHSGGTTFLDSEWPGVVSPRLAWTVTSSADRGGARRIAMDERI